MGEAELMDVRCADGGWNYGSHAALQVDLVAFPETTALALIGLQGHADLGKSLDLAARMAARNYFSAGARVAHHRAAIAWSRRCRHRRSKSHRLPKP